MFKQFRSFVQNALANPSASKTAPPPAPPAASPLSALSQAAPGEVCLDGMPPFPLTRHLTMHHGFPILDWAAVNAWLAEAPADAPKRHAWNACARGWLLHFRDMLPAHYALYQAGSALLLSALPLNQANAELEFMNRTQARVGRMLKGLASTRLQAKQIVLVFDNTEPYYDYVSYYYPERGGEFAATGGVYVNKGCGHYVLHGNNLGALERVIAHEMTHGQLAHLSLPRWLDEGIAINTERRLAGAGYSGQTPRELHERHRAHWNAGEIQKLWSGDAFFDPQSDHQHLSYDLARIIVEQIARDWPRFTRFALSATPEDGGAQAARKHLGMDLGDIVRALLERPDTEPWTPAPETWRKQEVEV